jgi:hypothetical protein
MTRLAARTHGRDMDLPPVFVVAPEVLIVRPTHRRELPQTCVLQFVCCRKWDPQPQEICSVDHHVNARTPRSVTPSVRMEPRAVCTRGTPLSARADEGHIPAPQNVCAFRPDRSNRRCLLRSLASMRFSRGPGGPGGSAAIPTHDPVFRCRILVSFRRCGRRRFVTDGTVPFPAAQASARMPVRVLAYTMQFGIGQASSPVRTGIQAERRYHTRVRVRV